MLSTEEKNVLLSYLKDAIKLESNVLAQDQIISGFLKRSEENKPLLHIEEKPAEPFFADVPLESSKYVLLHCSKQFNVYMKRLNSGS